MQFFSKHTDIASAQTSSDAPLRPAATMADDADLTAADAEIEEQLSAAFS